jgi:diaminopimelate epimerase
MALVTVTKCHGTGNDFVLLDARNLSNIDYAATARQLCHRRFSLGADGLLVIERAEQPECSARMRIFNADGSEAEMCGNGIRCVTMVLQAAEPKNAFNIETAAGIVPTEVLLDTKSTSVRVRMGTPTITAASNPYEVSIGNRHVVLFVNGDLENVEFHEVARGINEAKGAAVNVEVASVDNNGIYMRVHERGVGETWACGTGACAVAVAAITSGRTTSPVLVQSKGGVVKIEWAGSGQPVFLAGDANLVYSTQVDTPARSTGMSGV